MDGVVILPDGTERPMTEVDTCRPRAWEDNVVVGTREYALALARNYARDQRIPIGVWSTGAGNTALNGIR